MTQSPSSSFSPGMLPHRGTLILVLGILSLVICGFLGPAAWIMGKGDLAKIDQGMMDPTGRGITLAGMILGIIATILLALGLIFAVLWIIFVIIIGMGAAAAGAAGGG